MTTIYELENPDDVSRMNKLLNQYGIHFEYNLLNQLYVIVDKRMLQRNSQATAKPRKITKETRIEVLRMRAEGATVRQIAEKLSISIGSVSNILKDASSTDIPDSES
jgi:hypothetical protein